MFGGDNFAGSYNNDVLEAEPATEEASLSLVEEIKNRAKGCITSRNFPEAIRLYTKAIELSVANLPAKAILHANRSMCYLSMSNATSALEDAQVAVSTDASYIKGYYRVAMAQSSLKNFRGAREALMQGLTLKPDDKELKAQLVKVEADLARVASSPVVTPGSSSKSTTTTTTTVKKDVVASKPKPAAATTTAVSADQEDEDEDLRNLNVRGYKTTSDGRKTTFFNNELDETAKALIGNIAPKKLDATAAPLATAVAGDGNGSAWNTAGTYEERIVTPWAEEALRGGFGSIVVALDADQLTKIDSYGGLYSGAGVIGVTLTVSAVENVTGHAQITMMRGKKKQMCDFSADVKWLLSITLADGVHTVEGKTSVFDITADQEYEISAPDVTTFDKNTTTAASLPLYAGNLFVTLVKKSDSVHSLTKQIQRKLADFCAEFKTK